jgi:transposase
MLTRWPAFTRVLEDGRICLTNNAAERALRGSALGRKSWLFAGSQGGAERAAFMYTLTQTAKLNDAGLARRRADIRANGSRIDGAARSLRRNLQLYRSRKFLRRLRV